MNKFIMVLSVLFIGAQTPVWAQKETISITDVKPTPALAQSTDRAAKRNEMDRVLQSMNGQLIDRMNATRKFHVVVRSDLNDVIREQDFAGSGNVDPDDKSAAQQFKLAGVNYLLVTTADDFQDYNETATFQNTERKAMKRVIRFSCVGKIYDAMNGKLLESASFQICNKDISEMKSYSTMDRMMNDELLVAIADEMAGKIINRVIDVIFPPRVLSKRDKQITINRGDGTDIAVGQIWNVYAVGEELIDPDTKESLGKEEVVIGKIKITSVLPKTSSAEILEDFGIEKEAIVRKAP